jgi:glucosamine kinase
VFAGIDGGASNTRIKLVDADGLVRAASVPGPSSLTLSVEGAWERIAEALALVGIGPGLYPQVHLACALAGSRRSAARSAFAALAPAFASLALCSDGHATVLGAWGGQAGAAISIGTGIVGNCVAADGSARQIGGWGFPVRDEASGAWLGRAILAEVLRQLDGYDLEATALHQTVLETVGPSIDAIATWTHQATSTRYATLAPLVVEAAGRNDPAGLRLMRLAANEVAHLVDALDPTGDLPLCMGGSLANPIGSYLPDRIVARIQPSVGDACDGALLLARGLAGTDLDGGPA